jgi:NAD(P)-dependent dehydrogenase (short-subunit alcohol dehydrogenase family)
MLQLNLEDKVAIITGGSEGLGRAAAQKLAEEGARVAICARRKDVLENAAAAIKAKTGRDVLAVPTDVTRPEDIKKLVDTVVARWGGVRIINVTNLGGKSPAAKGLPTSVTRAAGINLTKSMSKEYAADRILVNTICIGLVKSAQWERRAKGGDVDAYYREVAPRVPIGRVGEAHEFADLVAFLASDRAAFITGTAINFDGGASAVV